jgi:hypothetical protein
MPDRTTVRTTALSLPEAHEELHFDRPSFRVRNRIFATLPPGDPPRAVLKLPREAQQALVNAEPETFHLVGWEHQGWTGVNLAAADPEELTELIEEAWRQVAPKRLVAERDRRSRPAAQGQLQKSSKRSESPPSGFRPPMQMTSRPSGPASNERTTSGATRSTSHAESSTTSSSSLARPDPATTT